MFFADFTKLKIDTDYNYLTKHFDLHMRNPMPVIEIEDQLLTALKNEHIEKTTLPVLYDFNISGEVEVAEIDELVGYILSLANIIVPTTLKFLETGNGYKRERRLDVPVKLKPLHTSFSCVKRACNNEILTPIMNIKITFSNITYLMCDGREIDEVKTIPETPTLEGEDATKAIKEALTPPTQDSINKLEEKLEQSKQCFKEDK